MPLDFAEAAPPVDTEKVLDFLDKVFGLDLSKYQALLTANSSANMFQSTGQYRLDSTGLLISPDRCGTSVLTVSFTFWGSTLTTCSFDELSQGPPYYALPLASDTKAAALAFLQRYQTYSGDAQLTQFRTLLENTDFSVNSTETVDNLLIEVNVQGDRTLITCGNVVRDADYNRLRLSVQGSEVTDFHDDRSIYTLGNSEVNTSQQEAQDIALQHTTTNYSISTSDIAQEHIRSHVSFLSSGDYTVLYPIWIVDLPLTSLHQGSVSYIEVMLWADSGDVISCEALGYGGSNFGTPSASQTPASSSPSDNDAPSTPNATYLLLVTFVLIILPFVFVFLKKRTKTEP
ncbi:MAG: hypothetical protein NWE92_09090 [Candidatus Bathyarchaeota archaeon]|nr:hypothetical protein [Candidatus Bathyarchaeota archaeon]